MLKWVIWIAAALIVILVVGVAIASYVTRIHPIKFARDWATGFQNNHPRHVNAVPGPKWDPVGEHNARVLAMDPGERAWPVLQEAYDQLSDLDPPSHIGDGPGSEHWPTISSWLQQDAVDSLVDRLEEAASRPYRGVFITSASDGTLLDDGSMLADGDLPIEGIRHIRTLRIVADRAALAGIEGDHDEVRKSLVLLCSLQELTNDPPALIEQTICQLVIGLLVKRVAFLLQLSPQGIDDATALELETELGVLESGGVLRLDSRNELLYLEDSLRRMVDDKGVFVLSRARGVASQAGTPPASRAPRHAINPDLWQAFELVEAEYAKAEAAASVPWKLPADGWADLETWVNELDSLPGRMGRLIGAVTAVSVDSIASKFRTFNQSLIGFRVALAAHRHRLRHGEPPATLDDIDSDLLTVDPIDGFTGGKLVYRWQDGMPLVYAAGADGDDDGGVPAFDEDGDPIKTISEEYLTEKPDGDFILFPPPEFD